MQIPITVKGSPFKPAMKPGPYDKTESTDLMCEYDMRFPLMLLPDKDIEKLKLERHLFNKFEAQKIALLGTAHIVRNFSHIV